MKNKNIILVALLAFFAMSCNDFLDETPDNRAEVNSKEKIQKMLVSAYSSNTYAQITELASDNIVDAGESNPNSNRFYEQLANWVDVTESDNADPKSFWGACYNAIASANQALDAISKIGEESLQAEKGEALITRAYHHFLLVNVFCESYNPAKSDKDPGVPYMEKAETTLNPKYERGTVKEVYEKINADIEAALPLISDDIYDVASYHFNKKAAYAFAARFNLYYQNWAKVKEYATKVVTENPVALLRNWAALAELPNKIDPKTDAYISDGANLMAQIATAGLGAYFGPYYHGARFNHTRWLANNETVFAPMPWAPNGVSSAAFKNPLWFATATNFDKTLFFKVPYKFEVTDPVQNIGYNRTVLIPFTTDETLLMRAEAEIMLGESDAALADLNIWTRNFYKNNVETTLEQINTFYDAVKYSAGELATTKKKLSPSFTIPAGQENLVHYLLQCRRVLTLHEGLRWFDIKRYGIEVTRLQDQNGKMVSIGVLKADDLRRAIQLPEDVVTAGLTPNKR